MSDPAIFICLDGNGRTWRPGETVAGEYRIAADDSAQVKSVEVSVLWYTEGKGDEDMAVHEFWRRSMEDADPIDLCHANRFSTVLPVSPLSYDGQIVQIKWCVRVRVFTSRGKDVMAEKIFRLGDVLPLKATGS